MSPRFIAAVLALRCLPEHEQTMVLHASLHWSDERLEQAEREAAVTRVSGGDMSPGTNDDKPTSDLIGETGSVIDLATRRART